ncbi:MAG: LysM peptidoglycan-binding domain-containing protein [Chloroflexi bacterium]|nr:LysM peptidoglycan-binding domain-containing protein [Chloroflexota bacterium]
MKKGSGETRLVKQMLMSGFVFPMLFITPFIASCQAINNPFTSGSSTIAPEREMMSTPLSYTLSPEDGIDKDFLSPTPDPAHIAYPELSAPSQHTVLPGETLETIAKLYGLNSAWISEFNHLEDTNQISAGSVIEIPAPMLGPNFKVIPNSELVYGPASINFDTRAFIKSRGGYLANYGQEVEGKYLNSAEIINLVSQRYSVNPRLLIALIQYQSGWLDNAVPFSREYPLGYEKWWSEGLYNQLLWGANELNRGYYLWRAGNVSTWTLSDNSMVMIEPTINAGTAGVQNFFAKTCGEEEWYVSVSQEGFFKTYFDLYGYPFEFAKEPLLPVFLDQPVIQLPFSGGESWAFTGGPHGGWDTGSPWSALDFAPPGKPRGCSPSDAWVVAVADGIIVYAEGGIVLLDLDGDGYQQTGWTVFYMHIENRDRIAIGTQVKAGDRIGHPSCEGGVATAAHVHLARKYNGEWIPAEGENPFVLDGWKLFGNDIQYGGYLQRYDGKVNAWAGYSDFNQIQR